MEKTLVEKSQMPFPLVRDAESTGMSFVSNKDVPFAVKRAYFIKDFSDKPRGFHSHKNIRQVLICLRGSCTLMLDDARSREYVRIDASGPAYFIDVDLWHEMHEFSSDCLLAVLASDVYREDDYIRDYEEFRKYMSRG